MSGVERSSRFARRYAAYVPTMDARGAAAHRAELVAGLTGRILEPGAGSGANFAYYPAAVDSVVAAEPDPYLRALAASRARGRTPAPIAVVAGRAEHLPVADGAFDAAVCSLVLCSVTDQLVALAELRRVLRPGGELRCYEHVRSDSGLWARAEDVVTPLWRRAAGNCHPNRDTVAAVRAAGFAVERVRRFGFAPTGFPSLAHVLLVARRA